MQVLSVQQLYKICTQYWDDKYNTESVSEEVIRESIFFNAQRYSHIQFHFNPDAHGMALAQFCKMENLAGFNSSCITECHFSFETN